MGFDNQVATHQFSTILLAEFADLQHVQRPTAGVQAVTNGVVAQGCQLRLHDVMKFKASLRLHEAGVRRVDERAEILRRLAQVTLAGGIEKQQGPAGFVQTLETQHAQPRRHWQLRHNLGRQTAGGIGMYFHRAVCFQYAAGVASLAAA